jgi:hypothetical protein
VHERVYNLHLLLFTAETLVLLPCRRSAACRLLLLP